MADVLIVGGGVVGLSVAYELAGHGHSVRVIDAAQPGREASWAAAGILPPAGSSSSDPLEQLTALSNRLHDQWAHELRETTQIDNGLRRSGAVYLARTPDEVHQLERLALWADAREIVAERLAPGRLAEIEPELRLDGPIGSAYLVPSECQIRSPRHLRALSAGCARRGVEITPGVAVEDFDVRGGRVRGVRTVSGDIPVERVCLTTGAWTTAVARKLELAVDVRPIRGQIVLISSPRTLVSRIINFGKRYLVPRPDGRVLIGSTEEAVGFDRGTTAGAVSELLAFALDLVPALATCSVERTWAGLRPASGDGLPYIGSVPGLENAYLAAGHFRGGLQLSTGTAVVMRQLIEGRPTEVDLAAFRPDRVAAPVEADPEPAPHPRPRRRASLH